MGLCTPRLLHPRVAPIRPLTIPRLELNRASSTGLSSVYAWTDSTLVLAWLQGNPRCFKVYVANRVAQIMDLIPAVHWGHVVNEENPADCASRGIFLIAPYPVVAWTDVDDITHF